MKPLFIALILLHSLFSNANDIPENIAPAATKAFNKTFKEATNVHWCIVNGDVYRAQFNYNNQLLYAFYNGDGEQICIGEIIELHQLPPMLQNAFSQKNMQGKIIDVFEVSDEYGFNYYVTIETETKRIILQSAGTSKWKIYQKRKIN